MSIATRKGDSGRTSLMYNRSVAKCHPRVEACGQVDELSSALGVARAAITQQTVKAQILGIQRDLITLMGELATAEEDLAKFGREGFGRITPAFTEKLDQGIAQLESRLGPFTGWAIPGDRPEAAALDLARTICRRAERRVCALREAKALENTEIIRYLNRLGDLLWLLARGVEQGG